MTDKVTLGRKIHIMRIIRGISQGELARRLKMHQPTLSSFERDHTKPSDDTLERIKTELDWPSDDQVEAVFEILVGDGG